MDKEQKKIVQKGPILENVLSRDNMNIIQILGKLALGFILFGYAIGLIVVNSHLISYGYYSLNLIRPVYIMAGMWALLPLLFSTTFFLIVLQISSHLSRSKTTINKYQKIISGLLLPILLIAVIISILFMSKTIAISLGFKLGWNWAKSTGLSSIFIILLLFAKSWHKGSKKGIWGSGFGMFANIFFLLIVIIFYVMGYLYHFGSAVYSDIPGYLGGGNPTAVQMIIDPQYQSYIEEVNINIDGGKNKSELLYLLHSTDTEYIVIPGERPTNEQKFAVSLKRSHIHSVIYYF